MIKENLAPLYNIPGWGEHFNLPSIYWYIPPTVRIRGGTTETADGHIWSWVEIDGPQSKRRIWTDIRRGPNYEQKRKEFMERLNNA